MYYISNWQDLLDTDNEFCGGNLINDERKRFILNDTKTSKPHAGYEEIEPLISWQNLTFYGDMNMGALICGVSLRC